MKIIKGTKRGHRSVSVIVYPDGTMLRGDVRLDLAKRLSTKQAAEALGMSQSEFVAHVNSV